MMGRDLRTHDRGRHARLTRRLASFRDSLVAICSALRCGRHLVFASPRPFIHPPSSPCPAPARQGMSHVHRRREVPIPHPPSYISLAWRTAFVSADQPPACCPPVALCRPVAFSPADPPAQPHFLSASWRPVSTLQNSNTAQHSACNQISQSLTLA